MQGILDSAAFSGAESLYCTHDLLSVYILSYIALVVVVEFIKSVAPEGVDTNSIVQSSESSVANNRKLSVWDFIGDLKIESSIPVPPAELPNTYLNVSTPPSSSSSSSSWFFGIFGGSNSSRQAGAAISSGFCPLCSGEEGVSSSTPSLVLRGSRTNSAFSEYNFPASPVNEKAWFTLDVAVSKAIAV